jgi:hypothetical protein
MDQPSAPTGLYLYEMKIKNSGLRSIKTLTWEYVFYDPSSKKEVGRRRFVTEVKLAPGKTRSVAERSVSPPTGIFTAAQSGKKSSQLYDGVVVIQSVEYEDGSTWQSGTD